MGKTIDALKVRIHAASILGNVWVKIDPNELAAMQEEADSEGLLLNLKPKPAKKGKAAKNG